MIQSLKFNRQSSLDDHETFFWVTIFLSCFFLTCLHAFSFASDHNLDKISQANSIWGEIVDCPSRGCALYKKNDLVYVRCEKSKLGLVREGDRFGIVPKSTSVDLLRRLTDSLNTIKAPLGQLEIISVGFDLVTAVILECHGLIRNGNQISPLAKTVTSLPAIPEN